jgi:phosphoenolpyruvate synthase/pyruvate phosphate dikinase
MNSVYPFSRSVFTDNSDDLELCGVRGQRMMELASLDIPILPGFILSNELVMNWEETRDTSMELLSENLSKMETGCR